MEITITNLTAARVKPGWLIKKIKQVIRKLKLSEPIDVSVVIVGRIKMKRWNRVYRGKNKPTDVLSFDLHQRSVPGIQGEIVLCHDEAVKITSERNISLSRAFLWLIIHGILHLAGYEHENVSLKQAQKMFTLQDKLVRQFHV